MKKKKTKGERLNWTPLREVKPLKLNLENLKGEIVKIEKNDKIILLVP